MTLAICPKCNGSCRMAASDTNRRCYGYDKATDTLPCNNCGGQTMCLRAFGQVPINPATGLGCLHEYHGQTIGNCLTMYVCAHCSHRYDIDSSD